MKNFVLLISAILCMVSCNNDEFDPVEEFNIIYNDTPLTLKKGKPLEFTFTLEQYIDENIKYLLEVWVYKDGDSLFDDIPGTFTFKGYDYRMDDNNFEPAAGVIVGENSFTYTPEEDIPSGTLVIMVTRVYDPPVGSQTGYGKPIKIPVIISK